MAVKDHVVTTFFLKPGYNGDRPIIHSYGPYTKSQAQQERLRMLRDDADRIREERASGCLIYISVNKLIDVEDLNKKEGVTE